MGDETTEPNEKSEARSTDLAAASSSSSEAVQEKKEEDQPPERKFTLPQSLAWIPANLTWSRLKPVIRCSLTAWVSLVLMVLTRVARPLGQVSTTSCSGLTVTNRCGIRPASSSLSVIHLLIASAFDPPLTSCRAGSFLSPPQGPFISVLERELYMVFFVTVSWALVIAFCWEMRANSGVAVGHASVSNWPA